MLRPVPWRSGDEGWVQLVMEPTAFIYDPDTQERDDAAFYVWDANGHQHIANVVYGNREVGVYCDGEMRIHLWADKAAREQGETPEIIRYTDRLNAAGITTDTALYAAIDAERLEFINNTWFDLYMSDETNNGEHADTVTHTLTDAIAAAKALITNDEAWQHPAN